MIPKEVKRELIREKKFENAYEILDTLKHKFLRAGLNATAYCDNHMQAIVASNLAQGDIAVTEII